MDIYDQATEREEKERELSLAAARSRAEKQRDYEAEICTGCSYATRTNFGKNCEAWSECLIDLQRRERAAR